MISVEYAARPRKSAFYQPSDVMRYFAGTFYALRTMCQLRAATAALAALPASRARRSARRRAQRRERGRLTGDRNAQQTCGYGRPDDGTCTRARTLRY